MTLPEIALLLLFAVLFALFAKIFVTRREIKRVKEELSTLSHTELEERLNTNIGGGWILRKGSEINSVRNSMGKREVLYFIENSWDPYTQPLILRHYE